MTDLVTTISDERLAERGVEVLKRIAASKMPLADADFIAQWVHDARQSLRAQGGVRVKPLEWREEKVSDRFSRLVAETQLGTYEAMQWSSGEFGGSMPSMNRADNNRDFSGLHNLEAAKAAAQADYERRILSSLEASPAPVSEEMLVSAYLRGVDWRKENHRHTDYPFRFKAARDYADATLAAKGGQ